MDGGGCRPWASLCIEGMKLHRKADGRICANVIWTACIECFSNQWPLKALKIYCRAFSHSCTHPHTDGSVSTTWATCRPVEQYHTFHGNNGTFGNRSTGLKKEVPFEACSSKNNNNKVKLVKNRCIVRKHCFSLTRFLLGGPHQDEVTEGAVELFLTEPGSERLNNKARV